MSLISTMILKSSTFSARKGGVSPLCLSGWREAIALRNHFLRACREARLSSRSGGRAADSSARATSSFVRWDSMVTWARRTRPVRGERNELYDDTDLSVRFVRLDGATGTVSVGVTTARVQTPTHVRVTHDSFFFHRELEREEGEHCERALSHTESR